MLMLDYQLPAKCLCMTYRFFVSHKQKRVSSTNSPFKSTTDDWFLVNCLRRVLGVLESIVELHPRPTGPQRSALEKMAPKYIPSFVRYLINFSLKHIRMLYDKNRNKWHASLFGTGDETVFTEAIRFVKQWRESNMKISQVAFYKWLIGHKIRCTALQLWCWTVEYLACALKKTTSTVE